MSPAFEVRRQAHTANCAPDVICRAQPKLTFRLCPPTRKGWILGLQNLIFPTSSMARPLTVTPVIFAVWPAPISASGWANDGWFGRLVALAENSAVTRSQIEN